MRWIVLLCLCGAAAAQQPQALAPTLARSETAGVVRLYLASEAREPFDLAQPTLTMQCSADDFARKRVQVFVNFGGVTDMTPWAPFKPTPQEPNPPRLRVVTMKMEFLGYRKVPSFKRQFELLDSPFGQMRYNPPGLGSSNLEEFTFFVQYLRALPTLKLTATDGKTASFLVTPLLARLHAEPLCAVSGL